MYQIEAKIKSVLNVLVVIMICLNAVLHVEAYTSRQVLESLFTKFAPVVGLSPLGPPQVNKFQNHLKLKNLT